METVGFLILWIFEEAITIPKRVRRKQNKK